jgi:hypothetical protein
MSARPELALVLVGFGRVARRLVELLGEIDDRLPYGWRIAGGVSRTRGGMFDAKGLDAGRLLTTWPDAAWPGARPAVGHALLAAVLPHLGK